jgi:hypothetical protein
VVASNTNCSKLLPKEKKILLRGATFQNDSSTTEAIRLGLLEMFTYPYI